MSYGATGGHDGPCSAAAAGCVIYLSGNTILVSYISIAQPIWILDLRTWQIGAQWYGWRPCLTTKLSAISCARACSPSALMLIWFCSLVPCRVCAVLPKSNWVFLYETHSADRHVYCPFSSSFPLFPLQLFYSLLFSVSPLVYLLKLIFFLKFHVRALYYCLLSENAAASNCEWPS